MAVEDAWMCKVDLVEGQIFKFKLFDLFLKKDHANYENMNNRAMIMWYFY
jgi:hypothetical protein